MRDQEKYLGREKVFLIGVLGAFAIFILAVEAVFPCNRPASLIVPSAVPVAVVWTHE